MARQVIAQVQEDDGVTYAFSLRARLLAMLFVGLAAFAVFLAGGQEAARSRDQSTRPAAGNGQLTQYFLLRENARAVISSERKDDPRNFGSDPGALAVVATEPSTTGHLTDVLRSGRFETWRTDHQQHGFLARGPPYFVV